MADLVVYPQTRPLTGAISVPGDKSISHRAVMLAALAEGTSNIQNWLPAGDTQATLAAIRSLGISVRANNKTLQGWDLEIDGQGLLGLRPPKKAIDCRNAGTCMRLLAGILVGQSFSSILDGSEQLRRRPMKRIIDPLQQMGADIEGPDGRAPLHINPTLLNGIDFSMPVASAQVKSAILLAGLFAKGETKIVEPGPARDHTERMLQAMEAPLEIRDRHIALTEASTSERNLKILDIIIPGDLSSAAFILVAAAIVPHSNVTVTEVGFNDTRTGLLDILNGMGANLFSGRPRSSGGEPVVDLQIQFDELHNFDIGGELVVRAIDEFPAWAVAATQASGQSHLREATELRVKEVDRIKLLAVELRKMGAVIDEYPDGMAITGPTRLQSAKVNSHGDHRLGMALAVAGLVANGPVLVQDARCIDDSFPGFIDTMRNLGAQIEWANRSTGLFW